MFIFSANPSATFAGAIVLFVFVLPGLVGIAKAMSDEQKWKNCLHAMGIVDIPMPVFPDGCGTWAAGQVHGSCYNSPTKALRDPLVVKKGTHLTIQVVVRYYDNQAKERYSKMELATEKEGLFELSGGDRTAYLAIAFAATAANPNPNATMSSESQGSEQLIGST